MSYKYSNYNIESPKFNDKVLVCNLLKESIITINKKEVYKLFENRIIPDDINLLNKFIKSGIIIDENINEIDGIINENEDSIKNRDVLSFTIFPSSNCQLGCVYCGQLHNKNKLHNNTHNAIIQTLEKLIQGKKQLNVGWFGGEPLLGIDVIIKLTPKLKELSQKYNCTYTSSITTNALLLNKKNAKVLIENGVNDIAVSIDGIEKYHDLRRPTKGGEGSYNIILKNLQDFFAFIKDNDIQLSRFMIRINVDKYNKEGVEPLFHELKNIGCQEVVTGWDIAPIHSWGNDAVKRALDFDEFSDFKLDMIIKLLELGLIKYPPFPVRVRTLCQAVTYDSLYVDARGQMYDCSEMPLVSDSNKYELGTIFDPIEELNKKRHYTNWNRELKNYPCLNCNILPVCGGGCPKSWKEGFIPCPAFKNNIGEYLLLSYIYEKNNKNFIGEKN